MKADSDELNGTVAHFINSHLDFPGLLGVAAVSDEEIQGLLRPVLTITNHRLKGTVCRKVDDQQQSPFKAEVSGQCNLQKFVGKFPGDREAGLAD